MIEIKLTPATRRQFKKLGYDAPKDAIAVRIYQGDVVTAPPKPPKREKKKYGIFMDGGRTRSRDLHGTYTNKRVAEKAARAHGNTNGIEYIVREV